MGQKLLKRIRQIIGVSANNLSVECLSLAEINVALAESYVFQTTVKCGWLKRNADLCDAASSDRNRRITLHIDNLTVLSCNLKLQATIVTLWKNNVEGQPSLPPLPWT